MGYSVEDVTTTYMVDNHRLTLVDCVNPARLTVDLLACGLFAVQTMLWSARLLRVHPDAQ